MMRTNVNQHPVNTIIVWGLVLVSLLLVPAYDAFLVSNFTLSGYLIATIPVVLFFTLAMLLSGRLFFSALSTHCVFLLLVYANGIKYQALVAPVMFEDLLFFQNPISAYTMFYQYVGIRVSKVTIVLLVLAVLLLMLWHERRRIQLLHRLLVLAVLLLVARQLISSNDIRAAYRQLGVQDKFWYQSSNLKQNGLYTTFVLSAVNTANNLPPIAPGIVTQLAQNRTRAVLPESGIRPDIIYYLSESLFDPGIMQIYQPCEFLALLCRLDDAAQLGVFNAPAYGGGTTKTEFAVLTGVNPEQFSRQLNIPYRKIMYQQANSMAWEMRSRGYRTIVIHPNRAEFYNRNVAMPNLGFDEFISLEDFPQSVPKNATYTDDAELNKKIFSSIADSDQPVFIMAISIENHGPWGKRKIRHEKQLSQIKVPLELATNLQQQLREYLYHVHYAEVALQELQQFVINRDTPTVLFFFGDHLPSLEEVFAQAGFDNSEPAHKQDTLFVYLKNYAYSQLPDKLHAHQVTPAVLRDLKMLRANQFYDLHQLSFGWDASLWSNTRDEVNIQAQLQQLHWRPPELTGAGR